MSKRFPVWKTVIFTLNGQEFEFDLIKLLPTDLGIKSATISKMQILSKAESLGLHCLDYQTGLIDEFGKNLETSLQIIYAILSDNRVFIINMFAQLFQVQDVNFYHHQYFIFIQPRALKATAGAPLQAA